MSLVADIPDVTDVENEWNSQENIRGEKKDGERLRYRHGEKV